MRCGGSSYSSQSRCMPMCHPLPCSVWLPEAEPPTGIAGPSAHADSGRPDVIKEAWMTGRLLIPSLKQVMKEDRRVERGAARSDSQQSSKVLHAAALHVASWRKTFVTSAG